MRRPRSTKAIQHILVATDFGPASDRALDVAVEMAIPLRAKVSLAHVLEAPHPYPIPSLIELRLNATRQLELAVASTKELGVDCVGTFLGGTPWRAIVRAADERVADLVVLGTHGRRGLAHALLGSVAERVVRAASMPVMTVRGHWFDDRTAAGRELARALMASFRASPPVVLAISAAAVLVAAEIGDAFGLPIDLLLTRPLQHGEMTFGAVSEEKGTRLDPDSLQMPITPLERDREVARARAEIDERALAFRGSRAIASVWRRTVLLVADELTEPWRVLAALDVVGRMAPDRVVIAAPIAAEPALAALRSANVEVVVLRTAWMRIEPSAAYRDFGEPADRAVRDRMLRTPASQR